MQNTRTYYRPNFKKFGKYLLFLLLSFCIGLYIWFQVFGYLPFGMDFLGKRENIVCKTEENGEHKRNKPRRVPKHNERPHKATENGRNEGKLLAPHKEPSKQPDKLPNKNGEKIPKTPHIPPPESKKGLVRYEEFAKSKRGDWKHKPKSNIGVYIKPIEYKLR